MLGQLLAFGRAVLTLTRRVEQLEADVKALKEERADDRARVDRLNDKVDRLTDAIQALAGELRRQNERSESEKRILLLEVENLIHRHARGLPPAQSSD